MNPNTQPNDPQQPIPEYKPSTDNPDMNNGPSEQSSTSLSEPPAHNPGKGLAIAGLVLAFLPLQLVGLILSIIALAKSVKGTSARVMAIIGLVLNILGMIVGFILILIILTAYNGIQQRAQTSASRTAATVVQQHVLGYAAENESLPLSISDIGLNSGNKITVAPIKEKPAHPSTVEYAICDDGTQARFGYWDYTSSTITYEYVAAQGEGTETTNCEIIKE